MRTLPLFFYFELFYFEFLQLWRSQNQLSLSLLFFILFISIFGFLINDPALFIKFLPHFIWTGLCFSCLIAIPNFLSEDYQTKRIEHMLRGPIALEITLTLRLIIYWVTLCLPLAFLGMSLYLLNNIPFSQSLIGCFTLIIGGICILNFAALGIALTMTAKHQHFILLILILPLLLPILILGIGSFELSTTGSSAKGLILYLSAFSLFSCFITPWLSAMIIRKSLE